MKISVLNPHLGISVYGNQIHNYFLKYIKSSSNILISDFNIFRILKFLIFTFKKPDLISRKFFFKSLLSSGFKIRKKQKLYEAVFDFSCREEFINPSFLSKISKKQVFHLGDYFFGSSIEKRLKKYSECKNPILICYFGAGLDEKYLCYLLEKYNLKKNLLRVPFGCSDRFIKLNNMNKKNILKKVNKVFITGSINKIRSIENTEAEVEAEDFFKSKKLLYMHPLRRSISLNKHLFNHKYFKVHLPKKHEGKAPDIDLINTMKRYRYSFSTNSIFNFLPSKVYESMILGCVPIFLEEDFLKELGFKHNFNCLIIKDFESINNLSNELRSITKIDDMQYYKISTNCVKFAEINFTHERIKEFINKKLKL
tara:strand:+ start:1012 stop:2115 length:1104 start_codon:yes stop_codon:yes gene_type:complete